MPLPRNRVRRAPVRLALLVLAGLLTLWAVAVTEPPAATARAPETSTASTAPAYTGPTAPSLRHQLEAVAAAVRFVEALPKPSPQARANASVSSSAGGVSSTAYCLTGHMANGEPARYGAVAANAWPIGTRLRVSPSPVGEIVVVADRIGSGSQLDFAMPGDCAGARAWGRRTVSVEVLA